MGGAGVSVAIFFGLDINKHGDVYNWRAPAATEANSKEVAARAY